MTGVDVNCFWGGGCSSRGRWRYGAGGLVDQAGKVDAVVREGIVRVSGIIPLHMSELAEVGQVIESEADVCKELGDVVVLWCVFCGQLVGMEVEPPYNLVFFREVPEMWWR